MKPEEEKAFWEWYNETSAPICYGEFVDPLAVYIHGKEVGEKELLERVSSCTVRFDDPEAWEESDKTP